MLSTTSPNAGLGGRGFVAKVAGGRRALRRAASLVPAPCAARTRPAECGARPAPAPPAAQPPGGWASDRRFSRPIAGEPWRGLAPRRWAFPKSLNPCATRARPPPPSKDFGLSRALECGSKLVTSTYGTITHAAPGEASGWRGPRRARALNLPTHARSCLQRAWAGPSGTSGPLQLGVAAARLPARRCAPGASSWRRFWRRRRGWTPPPAVARAAPPPVVARPPSCPHSSPSQATPPARLLSTHAKPCLTGAPPFTPKLLLRPGFTPSPGPPCPLPAPPAELLSDGVVSRACDVYSWGVLLWQVGGRWAAACGRPPGPTLIPPPASPSPPPALPLSPLIHPTPPHPALPPPQTTPSPRCASACAPGRG
jgi:hypothetical protein